MRIGRTIPGFTPNWTNLDGNRADRLCLGPHGRLGDLLRRYCREEVWGIGRGAVPALAYSRVLNRTREGLVRDLPEQGRSACQKRSI